MASIILTTALTRCTETASLISKLLRRRRGGVRVPWPAILPRCFSLLESSVSAFSLSLSCRLRRLMRLPRFSGWRVGINKRFKTARAFYAIIILSTLVGIAIDFANVNAIKALCGRCAQRPARTVFAGCRSYRGDRPQAHAQPPSSVSHDSAGCHCNLRDDRRSARACFCFDLPRPTKRYRISNVGGEVDALRRRDAAAQAWRPFCSNTSSSARGITGCQAGQPAGSLPAEYAFRQTSSPAAGVRCGCLRSTSPRACGADGISQKREWQ